MLETLSISQYANRNNLLSADNQQGRPEEGEPSTTIRTAPKKQRKIKGKKGYCYNTNDKRWYRIVTNSEAFCCQCEIFKSLDCFASVKGKPYHYCKDCQRLHKAMSRYNISFNDAKKLYQAEYCDCCNEPFKNRQHKHIHHIGNEVKGVVCLTCNHLLRNESETHLNRLKCCIKFIEQDEDRV